MNRHPNGEGFTDAQLTQLFNLDSEVIDTEQDGDKTIPVVRAYDTGKQVRLYCIHCRCSHYHGRGGDYRPFTPGRTELGGHRTAHCLAKNSPFLKHGYILDIIARDQAAPKTVKDAETPLCPECGEYYSAAFNTCACGRRGPGRSKRFAELENLYRSMEATE